MELEQDQIMKFLEQRHLFRGILTEEIEEIAPFFYPVSLPLNITSIRLFYYLFLCLLSLGVPGNGLLDDQ